MLLMSQPFPSLDHLPGCYQETETPVSEECESGNLVGDGGVGSVDGFAKVAYASRSFVYWFQGT